TRPDPAPRPGRPPRQRPAAPPLPPPPGRLRPLARAEPPPYPPPAHQARGAAFRGMAQLDRAEEDLVAALAAYESVGRDVDQPAALLPYLARFAELFDQMIAFQAIDRHRADRAFEYADRARTQALPAY